jgi:5-methylcytosine-specific restriction endonuclease McrA
VSTWTDHWGKEWHVITSPNRLKFKIPCHAALRRHVFHRDGYKCARCPAKAINVPADYSGRFALYTDTFVGRYSDVLVLDHIVTRPAGGRNVVENLQTLCETCNKRKQREDKALTAQVKRQGTPRNAMEEC